MLSYSAHSHWPLDAIFISKRKRQPETNAPGKSVDFCKALSLFKRSTTFPTLPLRHIDYNAVQYFEDIEQQSYQEN